MSLQQLFTHRCDIARYKGGNKRGHFEQSTPETVATGVRCRSHVTSSVNSDSNGRTVVTTSCQLLLPRETDIKNGDIIHLNGSPVGWVVAGEPQCPAQHHTIATLKKEEEL